MWLYCLCMYTCGQANIQNFHSGGWRAYLEAVSNLYLILKPALWKSFRKYMCSCIYIHTNVTTCSMIHWPNLNKKSNILVFLSLSTTSKFFYFNHIFQNSNIVAISWFQCLWFKSKPNKYIDLIVYAKSVFFKNVDLWKGAVALHSSLSVYSNL